MPPENKRATLSDIINYKPETYLTTEDLELLRTTFKGNERLLKTLRKVFLPSVGDYSMPPEEIGSDVWLNMDFAMMQNEEIKSIVLARQDAIKFIAGGLIRLNMLANEKIESPLNAELRRKKDSAQ